MDYLKSDLPNARYAFNNSVIMNKGAGLYFHPIADPVMEKLEKGKQQILSIMHQWLKSQFYILFYINLEKDLPAEVQAYIDSFKQTKQNC